MVYAMHVMTTIPVEPAEKPKTEGSTKGSKNGESESSDTSK